MSKARFVIVRQQAGESDQTYLGMDREPFGGHSDVSKPLILEGMALPDIAVEEAKSAYRAFWKKLAGQGHDQYDLLALGIQPDDDWEFLGYDVGETLERGWSAVAHRHDFLKPDEIALWEAKLNANGLFRGASEAESFLAVYLDSDDPDMGWAADGWQERPDWYTVIPIYRYRRTF
jgi:hypothetical protein